MTCGTALLPRLGLRLVDVLSDRRRARLAVAGRELVRAPGTPWVRWRCAPSAAARVKVLPHSGQVNALLRCGWLDRLEEVLVVRRARTIVVLSVVLVDLHALSVQHSRRSK